MKAKTVVIVGAVGVGLYVGLRQLQKLDRENNARNQKIYDMAESGYTVTRAPLSLPQYIWAKLIGGNLAVSV